MYFKAKSVRTKCLSRKRETYRGVYECLCFSIWLLTKVKAITKISSLAQFTNICKIKVKDSSGCEYNIDIDMKVFLQYTTLCPPLFTWHCILLIICFGLLSTFSHFNQTIIIYIFLVLSIFWNVFIFSSFSFWMYGRGKELLSIL